MPRYSKLESSSDVHTFDPRAPRKIWLEGDSLMCACPDCRAPISIRLWLMVADCWQCGCSIEVSDAQERQIQQLLRDSLAAEILDDGTRHDQAHSLVHRPYSPITFSPTVHEQPLLRSQQPPRQPVQQPLSQPSRRVPLASETNSKKHVPSIRRAVRNWFDQMPAWLISLLFHMAVLALLALLFFEGDGPEDPYITLSTEAARFRQSGGEVKFQNAANPFEYDLPVPKEAMPKTAPQRRALARAHQDAKELRVDPAASLPQLPSLAQTRESLRSTHSTRRTLAARDPRMRAEIVSREGGTTLTEAAVARGLRWLAQHQQHDGSWSLQFSDCSSCRGRCNGDGGVHSDSAATSLALLPFLGAGQTHQVGIYQDTVAKGLRWLLANQEEDGDLRARSSGNTGMYAQGQGAIVLCEVYALTGDQRIRDAAQKAIDFIVVSQHAEGGWRYEPGEQGDTSVLGWQLMALQSARAAQLDVGDEVLELAGIYLDSVQYDDGARYGYLPGRGPTPTMTAEALLCRMYLGWSRDYGGLQQGVKHLWRNHKPRGGGSSNFYYWYYATQVFHHFGGREWERWNMAMRSILVDSQQKRGHEAGSWQPRGPHGSQGGRLYCTSLAVCTLEVYYRHAPIFRQLLD